MTNLHCDTLLWFKMYFESKYFNFKGTQLSILLGNGLEPKAPLSKRKADLLIERWDKRDRWISLSHCSLVSYANPKILSILSTAFQEVEDNMVNQKKSILQHNCMASTV